MFVSGFETSVVLEMPRPRASRRPVRPNLERGGYSRCDGYALVDLALLSAQLEEVAVCATCKKGNISLKMGSNRPGFSLPLLLECTNK